MAIFNSKLLVYQRLSFFKSHPLANPRLKPRLSPPVVKLPMWPALAPDRSTGVWKLVIDEYPIGIFIFYDFWVKMVKKY
jgi:hypothetical protein